MASGTEYPFIAAVGYRPDGHLDRSFGVGGFAEIEKDDPAVRLDGDRLSEGITGDAAEGPLTLRDGSVLVGGGAQLRSDGSEFGVDFAYELVLARVRR